MNKKKHSPAKLRGAVLIMVLTIMFVLIFLLAGSIAVVYSANNRAMDKYRQSQSYYTVRSVLDTYVETLLKDNDNKMSGTGYNYYVLEKNSLTGKNQAVVAKDASNNPIVMTQGRALELDIYKLKAPVVDINGNDLTGASFSVTKTNFITKYKAGELSEMIMEQMDNKVASSSKTTQDDKIAEAADIVLNCINPDSTMINDYSDASDYYKQFLPGTDSKVTYKIDSAQLAAYRSGTDGNYGKVVDDGSDAYITVELLERYLDPSATGANFTETFLNGNRKKDHIKVKITATIFYNDEKVSSSMIYSTKYQKEPASSEAIKSVGTIGASGTGMPVDGGLASLAQNFNTNGEASNGYQGIPSSKLSGGVYIEGDCGILTGSSLTSIPENTGIVTKGDFYFGNDIKIEGESGAFIFANGKIIFKSQQTIGASGKPISVICNTFQPTNSQTKIYGSVFADKYDIYTNSGNNHNIYEGDLYCNEFICDASNNAAGIGENPVVDTGSEIIITIPQSKNFANNIHAQSVTIYKNGVATEYSKAKSGKPVYIVMSDTQVTSMEGVLNPNLVSGNKDYGFDYYTGNVTYDPSTYKKTMSLPDGTEINLDTTRSKFSQYFKADDFEDNGDLSDYSNVSSAFTSAETQASGISGVNSDCTIQSEENYASGNVKRGYLQLGTANNITVDLKDGDVVLQYTGSGALMGKITVVADSACANKLYLLLPGGMGNIDTVTTSSNQWQVIYEPTFNCDPLDENTPTPPVEMYIGSGTNLTFQNDACFTGYIYAPNSNIKMQLGGVNKNYKSVTGSNTSGLIAVMGSITCGNFECVNGAGVYFVSENNDANTPGERTFAWDDVLYTRGG